ncbi:MAG: hypothetical protein F4Y98_01070, partial [Chloroflexi bacterium]|nr:hypothetical protein [Chloroflexota bacterium]
MVADPAAKSPDSPAPADSGGSAAEPEPDTPDPSKIDRKARMKLPANTPEKQPADVRVHNWDEVFHLFDPETAKAEAVRCIQCPAAPCTVACPVDNDIPGALWLLEQGDFDGAANI